MANMIDNQLEVRGDEKKKHNMIKNDKIRKAWSWLLLGECFFWNYVQVVIPNKKLKALCLRRALKVAKSSWKVRRS